MLSEHVARDVELTIGCVAVPLDDASAFGVMSVDADQRVLGFIEKPHNPQPMPGSSDTALCSMGIYMFNAERLYELLIDDATHPASSHDFGKDVIPRAIARGDRVFAHDLRQSAVTERRPARTGGTSGRSTRIGSPTWISRS